MKTSLEKAIAIAGSQTALANAMGLKQGHVWDWLNKRSGRVPAERVKDVCRAVNWQITPHQLREDVYEHPDDGLPDALRGRDRVAEGVA